MGPVYAAVATAHPFTAARGLGFFVGAPGDMRLWEGGPCTTLVISHAVFAFFSSQQRDERRVWEEAQGSCATFKADAAQ
jgi:hypothetical protein